MSPTALENAESLKDAFQVFNEISQSLTRSYLDLESQVARLSLELSAARSERLKTLTEKEQLAHRLQRLLEALPAGVIVADRAGNVVDFNPAAVSLLGELRPSLPWRHALDQASVAAGENPRERQLRGNVTVSLSVCSLGEDAGQIIVLTDISEQRALQELVNQQKRLSALGEMVASLAHQIRTPLAAALLYTGHLTRDDLTGEQRMRFGARLSERLQHLERQVADMLAFARVGRLVMERVLVDDLISNLRETFEPTLEAKAIRFTVDHTPNGLALFGNPDALLGILLNLLGNAMEALAESGGTIRLSLTAPRAGWLRIEVADNGPGIADDVLPRIFQAFFTTRANGTGLGLAVVDCVVRAHGGHVACRSSVGAGARFVIDLPLAQAPDLLPGGYSGLDHSPKGVNHER